MSEALRTSALQWGIQLENAIKDHPMIAEYEISIELSQSKQFSNGLDGRSRWGQHITSTQDTVHHFQIRAFLQNDSISTYKDMRRFADSEQTPAKILTQLLLPSNQMPNAYHEKAFVDIVHLGNNLEIEDPRFHKLDAASRKELMQDHHDLILHMNKKARLQSLHLTETERCRHVRTRKNTLLEIDTEFELIGSVSTGVQRESFHIKAKRFSDLCTHLFGWSAFYPPPTPNRLLKQEDISVNWMLILAPNVVASILNVLPPAFEAERLMKGTSFLAGRQNHVIGSKRIHILDDASVLSGLHSRGFDANGVPSKPLTLISDGVFQDFYIPLDMVHATQRPPTGHSDRHNRLWTGNILSQMGRRSQNMILADRGEALLATHLLSDTTLNIETGMLHLTANFDHISAQGLQGRLGTRTIQVPILDLFMAVAETANDQNRYGHIDASSWILDDCSLLLE